MPVDSRSSGPDDLAVNIGAAIRASRGAMSQATLGRSVGVRQATISRWERGGGDKPTVAQLLRIEEALDLQRGALFVAAGLVTAGAIEGVERAILGDPGLDARSRQLLVAVYRAFLNAQDSPVDKAGTGQ